MKIANFDKKQSTTLEKYESKISEKNICSWEFVGLSVNKMFSVNYLNDKNKSHYGFIVYIRVIQLNNHKRVGNWVNNYTCLKF